MQAVLVEFECPQCGRKVRLNPTAGEVYDIVPGDDQAVHHMHMAEYDETTLVLSEELLQEYGLELPL